MEKFLTIAPISTNRWLVVRVEGDTITTLEKTRWGQKRSDAWGRKIANLVRLPFVPFDHTMDPALRAKLWDYGAPKPPAVPQVPPPAWDLSELRQQVSDLMAAHPALDGWGYHHWYTRRKEGEDRAREIQQDLLTDEVLREIATARDFIEIACTPRKTINRENSSYGWKHDAERWGRENNRCGYVRNGAFIAAALLCGLELATCYGDYLSPYFNLGEPRKRRRATP